MISLRFTDYLQSKVEQKSLLWSFSGSEASHCLLRLLNLLVYSWP